MNGKYILNGHEPVPCHNLYRWALWFERADRSVARDMIGEATVSTVFLGLDHCYTGGPPLLFETLVFDGEHDGYMVRCSTWDGAERQHAATVAMVKGHD